MLATPFQSLIRCFCDHTFVVHLENDSLNCGTCLFFSLCLSLFFGRVLSNDFIDSFSSVRQAAIWGILLLAFTMSVSALAGSVTPTAAIVTRPVTPAMSMSGPATPTAGTDAAPQYLPQLRHFEHKVQKDEMRLLQRKLLEQCFATRPGGFIGCVALVTGSEHRAVVEEWIKQQYTIRIGDSNHMMHDVSLTDDVRRVFSSLFEASEADASLANADDDVELSDVEDFDAFIDQ